MKIRDFAWPRERRPAVVLALSLAGAAALAGTGTAEPAAPTREQVDQGRDVYDEFCSTCHGRNMVPPPGIVTSDLRKFPKNDAARFRASVLDGKGPAMPPWRGKLSDDDIAALWAYVRGGP